jgi:hypothetical protein
VGGCARPPFIHAASTPVDAENGVERPAHLINLVTSCTSGEEFVAQFQPFLDETTIFVPSKLPLTPGHPVEFSIALKDTRPMLEGRGEVIEVVEQPTAAAPRAGVRIRISELTAQSSPIRTIILAANRPQRATAKTSLFAHPVRTIPTMARGERVEAGPLGDISTQALTFYIECNLSAVEQEEPEEPREATEATVRAPPPPVPVDARRDSRSDSQLPPAMLDDELYQPPRFFDLRTLAWKARQALPIAGASVATLVVCWLVWGRPAPHRPAPAAVAAAAPAPVPAPVTAPVPAPATAPVPAATLTAAAPAAPKTPKSCTATITSQPTGATVSLGGKKLGATPLASVEVPCEKQVLTLNRPRYNATTAVIEPAPGTPAAAFVRMNRPGAHLLLVSSPANATFMVNGTVVGRSPQEVPVLRYERARIEATLPGHRPWGQVVYLAARNMKVTAVLSPARPGARR